MKTAKKTLALSLVFLLIGIRVFIPVFVYADDLTPTPTPDATVSDTSTPTVTDSSTTSDTSSDTPAQTSDTSIQTSDTASDPLVTPTPDATSDTQNTAAVDNSINTNSTSGDNTASASASSDSTGGSSTVSDSNTTGTSGTDNQNNSSGSSASTGDAVSVVNGENSVNETSVDSQVVYQTLNIFIDQNANLDLSAPLAVASNIVQSGNNNQTINVLVSDVNNYAYLSNDVISYANTGGNDASGQEASIKTGDAYSILTLLNKVNFTVSGSVIHILTINIFGNLNGNIILPDFSSLSACTSGCGVSTSSNATSSATVNNNINSTADSGNNTISSNNGSGQISTGDSQSAVNTVNVVNTNFWGALFWYLFINVFGTWDGNFAGWNDVPGQAGGQNMFLAYFTPVGDGSTCGCAGQFTVYNQAQVDNNISSTANSGGNSINGSGTISTGNAYSAVSLINFVNVNMFNSLGFFAIINIFGHWTGSIGSGDKFRVETTDSGSPSIQSSGPKQDGALVVTTSNNVGPFVNPGDTVTFFVDIRNPGNGDVDNTKLNLSLIYKGVNLGGASFDVGHLSPGQGVRLTTGFVLSKTAPGGIYIARASVSGTTGEDGKTISSQADSSFSVFGSQIITAGLSSPGSDNTSTGKVLSSASGPKNSDSGSSNAIPLIAFFVFFSGCYLGIRSVKRKEYLKELFEKGISFKERVYSLRLFLL